MRLIKSSRDDLTPAGLSPKLGGPWLGLNSSGQFAMRLAELSIERCYLCISSLQILIVHSLWRGWH